ncbi:hypothetical protein EES42_18230 [Streptomyces sp. ADI95-17]|nr:hypothetical protein EES42_18230 [Streptomyces sp. ADI95-17]
MTAAAYPPYRENEPGDGEFGGSDRVRAGTVYAGRVTFCGTTTVE